MISTRTLFPGLALSLLLVCSAGASYLVKYWRVDSGVSQLRAAMTERQVLEILGTPDAQSNVSEITSASEGWLMFVGTPVVAATRELAYFFPLTAEEWRFRLDSSGRLVAKNYSSSP